MPSAARPFSAEVTTRLATRGVAVVPFVLHCGVSSGDYHEPPGAEWFRVPATTADAVNQARRRGNRVVAVGTTAVRTLESAWEDGRLRTGPGRTEIFIRPGHAFRAVDGLATNFHLPRSTLLALACAFGGTERVLAAYREAVALRYRCFSYGDAMVMI
jgi:S-adenosylmethionine:tRNA ribosyltransferase-isomerase